MIILPAIDIKDGNCVRLFKGDFATVEKVASDYMETPVLNGFIWLILTVLKNVNL